MQQEPLDIALEIANQVEQLPEQYRAIAFRAFLEYRLGTRTGAPVRVETSGLPVDIEEMSFSEFLNQLGELRKNPQRFAAAASYYERYRRESSVTQEEIIGTMTDAGLRPPANFPRDIRVATSTRSALLMPSREPKNGQTAWQLTRTGRQFIERRLSSQA